MARTVMARQGASWRGRLGKVRLVGLRYGEVRRVTAWQAWCGKARQGQAGFGKSRQAWFGAAGLGEARRGKSWQACHGKAE